MKLPVLTSWRKKVESKPVAFDSASLAGEFYSLPWLSFQRQFRWIGLDGKWHTSKSSVCSSDVLKREFAKTKGYKDAYVTISRWLNPSRLSAKKARVGWRWDDHVFLGSDFLIDVDHSRDDKVFYDTVGVLEDAFGLGLLQQARLAKSSELVRAGVVVDVRSEPFFVTAVKTGKGWHFWLKDWYRVYTGYPRLDEDRCLKEMRLLCAGLRRIGLVWDEKVSCDTRRIARVWGSVHSKTGNKIEVFKCGWIDAGGFKEVDCCL